MELKEETEELDVNQIKKTTTTKTSTPTSVYINMYTELKKASLISHYMQV